MSMPVIPPFDPHGDSSSLSQRWELYLKRFEGAMVGFNITTPKRKRALLLHFGGELLQNVFDTLSDTGTENDYDKARDALTSHFVPKKNVVYQTILFRRMVQQDENVSQFCTRLRKEAEKCEFGDVERELVTQIITGCKSGQLRRRALEKQISLKDLLDLAASIELSQERAHGVELDTSSSSNVNRVTTQHNKPRNRTRKSANTSARVNTSAASAGKKPPSSQPPQKSPQEKNTSQKRTQKCGHCGYSYPHRGQCPAKGKQCNVCQRMNHFGSVCRGGRPVQSVLEDPDGNTSLTPPHQPLDMSDSEYVFALSYPKPPSRVNIAINDVNCPMIVDSGCSRNIIDEAMYKKLHVSLKPSSIRLFPYGATKPLHVLGVFTPTLESRSKIVTDQVFVVKGSYGCLLGRSTAEELELLTIQDTTNAIDGDPIIDHTSAYPTLFTGIGKLKDTQIKLHIDTSVPPVAQRFRNAPFHLRKQIEQQLNDLQEADIIEDATGPTPWVSPIVVVPKANDPNTVRICVDMRAANKAVIRERHPTPTMDELIAELNGSTVFSKLDLKSGYHQLELDPESRYITTFATHVGLKRYKRLNFGISSASEVFQNAIRQTIEGIPGVLNVSDDILVHAPDQASHDERLNTLFKRLLEHGLTLNKQKCQFCKSTISFFGLVFSAQGVSPDPEKVDAIHEAARPTSAQEVRSLLGMASYSSRFIPNLSTITAPLRSLMIKGAKFEWNQEHEAAWQALKGSISKTAVSAYFDTAKHTTLYVDASPVGLGAMLTQEGRTIIYASRSLTPTEQRYSQIEREALAIAWGVNRLHTYLFGRNFTVVTDHKPLIPIFGKPKIVPSARIANWMLKLQHYDMDVVHAPGKTNPADYISRHPRTDNAATSLPDVDTYLNFVTQHATPKTVNLHDIRSETARDPALQATIAAYRSGRWEDIKENHRALFNVRNEITVTEDNIVLRDKRIVIPESLQMRVIEIAHECHQGIVRTKSLLRSKVWFESLDREVESLVKVCPVCQTVRNTHTRPEPLKMSEMPPGPWQNLSIDFCGPLPTGEYLMVLIDEYSRYPVVEIVSSVSAKSVIPILDKVLSVFGFPKVVKSDNGSPFNSQSFADYASHCGFQHRKITPHYPQANAQAEAFNKPLITALRAAHLESKNWKQELYKYLRQYRATPHSSTGVTPFRLMFNRDPVTRLPEIGSRSTNNSDENAANHDKAKKNDAIAKEKQKSNADKRLRTAECDLSVGDIVIVRRDMYHDKLTSPYDPKPLQIIARKGNMITAKCLSTSRRVTRNVANFKRSPMQPMPAQKPKQSEQNPETTPRKRSPPSYLKDYVQ